MSSSTNQGKSAIFDKVSPFALLIISQMLTAFGTVQVLKTDIKYISQTLERHESEITRLRDKT